MTEPNIRQLAQLLHTVLNAKRYTRRADLVEDFKTKCAKFHVPYDSASVESAIRMVEGAGRRNDIPIGEPEHELPRVGRSRELVDYGPPAVSRQEASSILVGIRKRLKVPDLKPKRMPHASPLTARDVFEHDRAQAAQAVIDAILESEATCDALESTLPPPAAPLLDTRAHLGDGDSAAREARAEPEAPIAPTVPYESHAAPPSADARPCPDCRAMQPTCETRSGPFLTIACRVCGHVYAVRDAEPARTWTRSRHRTFGRKQTV